MSYEKIKVLVAVLLLFSSVPASAQMALEVARKKCVELGFKAGTEAYGRCALRLSRQENAAILRPAVVADEKSANRPPPPAVVFSGGSRTLKDCDVCPELVQIPGGQFLMGSKDDPFADVPAARNEIPQRTVTVPSFAIGKFEVTQEQWYAVMGSLPPVQLKGRTLPVSFVSYSDIQAYLSKISSLTGKVFRLPTEAEWEYAARGGTSTRYSWGDAPSASYASFGKESIKPVGSYPPNDFGVYDMHGNVWEMVEDCWFPNYVGASESASARIDGADCDYRATRGGSADDPPNRITATHRDRVAGYARYQWDGFRVARDLGPEERR